MIDAKEPESPGMIDVSTVIVNWNSRQYLAKCLDTMLSRKRTIRVEVIVVDNASSDGAVGWLKKEYPEVTVIESTENVGFARGNNMGIRKASGRYICLVNPDVEFRDECLQTLCEFMERNQDVGICGPKILNGDGSIQYSCREYPTLWNNLCFALGLYRIFPHSAAFSNELMSYFGHDRLRKVEAISGCFMMSRREAMEEVGLLDESFFMYSEDLDWCKRFNDKGWKIVFNPAVSALHYGGGSSENEPARFAVEKELAIIQYWNKHHGAIENALIRIILLTNHALRIAIFGVLSMLGSAGKSGMRRNVRNHAACFRSLVNVR